VTEKKFVNDYRAAVKGLDGALGIDVALEQSS
jgi:hypothetical protein